MSDYTDSNEHRDPAMGLERAGDDARAWAAALQTSQDCLVQRMAESPDMSAETRRDAEALMTCFNRAKSDAITYASSMSQLSAHFSNYLTNLYG